VLLSSTWKRETHRVVYINIGIWRMVKLLEWKGKKKNRESNKEHVHRKEEKDFFSYFFKGFLCLSLCWFYQQSQIGAKEKKKRPRGQWHLTLPRAVSLSLSLSLSFSLYFSCLSCDELRGSRWALSHKTWSANGTISSFPVMTEP
jgi:hypothetical protein